MESGNTYTLASGAKLFVSMSEYEKIMALHDALGAELRGGGLGTLDVAKIQKALEVEGKKRAAKDGPIPFNDEGEGDEGLNIIVDKLLGLASSKAFKTAIFACAEKAVYMPDGTQESSVPFRIGTPGYGVFDNPTCRVQALGDFYDICKAIVEENLRPFGKALFSMFMDLMGRSADSQESTTVKA